MFSRSSFRLNPARSIRGGFSCSLLVGAYLYSAIWYSKQIYAGGNGGLTGEWLINYAGGYVRRGLFGELFLALAPPGMAGLWSLYLIQCFLYVPLVILSLTYLRRKQFSWSSVALACNPAAVMFIGLDPGGFARKESLGLFSLVLLAMAGNLSEIHKKLRQILRFISVILFVFSVFASEINFLILIPLVYLLTRDNKKLRFKDFLDWPIFVSITGAVSALFSSLVFRGDIKTVGVICSHIQTRGYSESLCSGGISSLGWTLHDAFVGLTGLFPGYKIYLPLLILAILPLVSSSWFTKNWRWAVASLATSAPLYFVALDWGRWIFIFVMSMTILIMTSRTPTIERFSLKFYTVLPFVLLWSLPHYGADYWPLGVVEKISSRIIGFLSNLI